MYSGVSSEDRALSGLDSELCVLPGNENGFCESELPEDPEGVLVFSFVADLRDCALVLSDNSSLRARAMNLRLDIRSEFSSVVRLDLFFSRKCFLTFAFSCTRCATVAAKSPKPLPPVSGSSLLGGGAADRKLRDRDRARRLEEAATIDTEGAGLIAGIVGRGVKSGLGGPTGEGTRCVWSIH